MFALKCAQSLPRAVRVEWVDGLVANYTYVWLRDNGHRRPALLHLDLNSKPQNVGCDNTKLSVMWPPFLPSNYSSKFLREHSCVKPAKDVYPAAKKILKQPWRVQEMPSGSSCHMATVQWGERAVECATVWPQLETVPSIVTLEPVETETRVHVVDAVQCLSEMSMREPEMFRFLATEAVEYQHGFFRAAHRVANVSDGKIVACVFNNDMRSSEITTDALDMMYQSLKAFNKICCEFMQTIWLRPGQILVVDNAQTLVGAPAQTRRRLNLRLFH